MYCCIARPLIVCMDGWMTITYSCTLRYRDGAWYIYTVTITSSLSCLHKSLACHPYILNVNKIYAYPTNNQEVNRREVYTVLLLVPWQSWLSWWRWSGTPTTLVCGPSDRLAMPCPLPLQTVGQWRTADCLHPAALHAPVRSGQTTSAERHVHIMKNCNYSNQTGRPVHDTELLYFKLHSVVYVDTPFCSFTQEI